MTRYSLVGLRAVTIAASLGTICGASFGAPPADSVYEDLRAKYGTMDRYADATTIVTETTWESDVGVTRNVSDSPMVFVFNRDGRGLAKSMQGAVAFDGQTIIRTGFDPTTFTTEQAEAGETITSLVAQHPTMANTLAHPMLTLLDPANGSGVSPLGAIVDVRGIRDAERGGTTYYVLEVTTRTEPTDDPMRTAMGMPSESATYEASIWVEATSGLVRAVVYDSADAYRALYAQSGMTEIATHEVRYTFENIRLDDAVENDAFRLNVDGRQEADSIGWNYSYDDEETTTDVIGGLTDASRFVHEEAPGFSGRTLSGEAFELSSLRGKVVLIDFWATWCAPCVRAIPSIQKLSERYGSEGLVVVGVNQDQAGMRDVVETFVAEHGVTFTQVMDTDGAIGEAYGVTGIPTTVLIDREGVVQSYGVGFSGEEAYDEKIRRVLAGEKLEKPEAPAPVSESFQEVNAGAVSVRTETMRGAAWLRQPFVGEDGVQRVAMVSQTGGLVVFTPSTGAYEELDLDGMNAGRSISAFTRGPDGGWLIAWSSSMSSSDLTLSGFKPDGTRAWSARLGVTPAEQTMYQPFLATGDLTGDGQAEAALWVGMSDMSSMTMDTALLVVDAASGAVLTRRLMDLQGASGVELAPAAEGRPGRLILFGFMNSATVEFGL